MRTKKNTFVIVLISWGIGWFTMKFLINTFVDHQEYIEISDGLYLDKRKDCQYVKYEKIELNCPSFKMDIDLKANISSWDDYIVGGGYHDNYELYFLKNENKSSSKTQMLIKSKNENRIFKVRVVDGETNPFFFIIRLKK